jgi:murein DD-endopeptidase MepM/ murein hydrolase activator NlpD
MMFARLSALTGNSQIFKLPFSDTSVRRINGWLYGTNSWHHAVDYSIEGKTSFAIKAAAAGVVEFIGWDNWSGNTIVVRHDSAEGTDTYRTVYMHLRNGPAYDCGLAWSKTISSTQDPALRNPNADHWGTNSQKTPVSVGQSVAQGQIIAYSGQTGPGGALGGGGGSNTNNHLHIFFTRKDKTNNEFYFVDPYGIYGVPSCYPNPIVGPYPSSQNICARYPILFKNGYPQYS